jgi:hypothetical protein
VRSHEWWQGLELQGAIFELNNEGKTISVEAIRYPVETPVEEQSNQDQDDDSSEG